MFLSTYKTSNLLLLLLAVLPYATGRHSTSSYENSDTPKEDISGLSKPTPGATSSPSSHLKHFEKLDYLHKVLNYTSEVHSRDWNVSKSNSDGEVVKDFDPDDFNMDHFYHKDFKDLKEDSIDWDLVKPPTMGPVELNKLLDRAQPSDLDIAAHIMKIVGAISTFCLGIYIIYVRCKRRKMAAALEAAESQHGTQESDGSYSRLHNV